jgi:hypothetical protein
MNKIILTTALTLLLTATLAHAIVFSGVMDNRANLPFIPGFTGHSRAWITGGDPGAGLRLEWQADNVTTPGAWTYTYRVLRNPAQNKGFAYFDIETAGDFSAADILGRQVVTASDRLGAPIPSGLAAVTISDPVSFTAVHDFSNAAVTEAAPLTVLSKLDLSHYSGDPGRVGPGQPGGTSSATPSVGPVPHPFYGMRVTFPGDFATLVNLGYETTAWEFRVVTNRVPMWGDFFGWGDQTILSPYWYTDFFSNQIDDPARLALAPIDSLTGAGPYQGWVLVPGPLPSVASTNPADGVVTVPVTEPVTAVFGGLMDPSTITAATFTLANGATPVAGIVGYDQASKTATFTPDLPLVTGTLYTATITTGAADLAGNHLATARTWNFTTATPDLLSPAVTATFPNDGATFVAVTTPFTATFSEEIDPLTLNPATFTVTGGTGPVGGTVSFNVATRTATFTPDAPLVNNTGYTATVTTGITDLAGNSLPTAQPWSITTIPQETILPYVAATLPAARAANVAIKTSITATFSEPMDPATITGTTFTVAGVTGTVSYDVPSLTATFTPAVPLANSTTYRVAISTAARDLAGNSLPLVKSWSFTTAPPDNVPPTVFATSPSNGATGVPASATVSAAFSEQVDPATVGPATLTITGQTFSSTAPFSVTGAFNLSSGGITLPTVTFTPDAPLPLGTVYTARVSGVKDLAGNQMAADKTWSFTTMPDGILSPGETSPSIADALSALRIAVSLVQPTQDDRNHGDVAPLGPDGKPRPDGVIDVGDAFVILRRAVNLISW